MGLPDILEKILCNFLDNRKAKINIGNDYSNAINLLSGVPQGSVLSPSLYTLHTNDLPRAECGRVDITYADDITQVMATQSKSKLMIKVKLEREIERINKFERQWKIKTNKDQFKILPIAQGKTAKLTVGKCQRNGEV